MKVEWLIKKECSNLILFFAGWGMDAHPFEHISSEESDVIILSDYRDGNIEDLLPEIRHHESIKLIAWSLGVAVADLTCRKYQFPINDAVAINGTPCPADDNYGIPQAVFDGTIESLDDDNLQKFYRRMCRKPEALQFFLKNAPERSLEELRDELTVLRHIAPIEETVFQKAFVSKGDRIIPPANQMDYWQKAGIHVTERQDSHFIFQTISSWEEFFNE